MAVYNKKSLKAEEFINDGEILETIKYAEENKNNIELIDSILEKAKPKKTADGIHCEGLNHREASVLLACENEEKINADIPTNLPANNIDLDKTIEDYDTNRLFICNSNRNTCPFCSWAI